MTDTRDLITPDAAPLADAKTVSRIFPETDVQSAHQEAVANLTAACADLPFSAGQITRAAWANVPDLLLGWAAVRYANHVKQSTPGFFAVDVEAAAAVFVKRARVELVQAAPRRFALIADSNLFRGFA